MELQKQKSHKSASSDLEGEKSHGVPDNVRDAPWALKTPSL
jgi:hypothetical protein